MTAANKQPKLSKPQAAVVKFMDVGDIGGWWLRRYIKNARQRTLDALVRKGVLAEHLDEYGDLWYRLNSEAERVRPEDIEIPF